MYEFQVDRLTREFQEADERAHDKVTNEEPGEEEGGP